MINKPACSHKGWSLWINWWEWWCTNCGVCFPEYHLIGLLDAHTPGDVKDFDEEVGVGATT